MERGRKPSSQAVERPSQPVHLFERMDPAPTRSYFDNPFAQVEDAHVRRQIWWSLFVVVILGVVAYQEINVSRLSTQALEAQQSAPLSQQIELQRAPASERGR